MPIKFLILFTSLYFLYSCSPDLPIVPPINPTITNEFHPGKFIWRDLMTDDIPSVKKFYSELFGWTYMDVANGDNDYTVILSEGKPIAGMFKLRDVKAEHKYSQWISYISVADMNQAINYTKNSGGKIYREPFELPNRGTVAYVFDSQNAVLAFVKSSSGDPEDGEPVYNDWLWTELWTNNIENSNDFYTELFGYNVKKFLTAGENLYYVFQNENKPRAGMLKISFENVKPHWMPYIAVKNPSEIVKKVEQLGGTIYLGMDEIASKDAAIIADPSGAVFTVQKWPLDKGKLNEVKNE
jgi:predicted enzyme related to lactoylglutathione lyase